MFYDILLEKNKKLLETFGETFDELPQNYSYCLRCMSFKKTSLEQEIKHYEKLDAQI